ncbi:MAG: DUF2501 domain-containing protein [Lautropia sp.]
MATFVTASRARRLTRSASLSAPLLAALLLAAPALHAQGLDALKGAISGGKESAGSAAGGLGGLAGGAIPSLGSVGTGNLTGVLGYCAKNNLLGGDAAGVQQKLLGKLGGEEKAKADPGYQEGLKGVLGGNSDKKFDLGGGSAGLKSKVTEQVCDQVLKHGKSLI